MKLLEHIRVTRIETRSDDAWYDMGLRQLRNGEVRFYKVRDFVTGEWLLKTCRDNELGKVLVKAVKCPAGPRFAQLEGNTMVFQKSVVEHMLYDVVSLAQADENDRLTRKIAASLDEIPPVIRDNYRIVSYEEATGKTAPGKHFVTLSNRQDEKGMAVLFLLERAWTVSKTSPEEKLETLRTQERHETRKLGKEIDTGQTWKCPVCGDEFRLKHIEKEKTTRHSLKK